MNKKQLDLTIAKLILQRYDENTSINKIVNEFGITRRIIERVIVDSGRELKTKSQQIAELFPVLKDRECLLDMYYKQAMSIDEIAHEIGTNSQVIKTAFKRLEIALLPQNVKRSTKYVPARLRDSSFLNEEYVNKKRSVSSIARQFGVSDTMTRTVLKHYGITRRSHQQQMKQSELTPEKKINSKIARRLRSRLSNALSNDQKAGSAVKDLGCSIEELKKHLESKFHDNMSWDDYGYRGWHIDHIKPLDSFDLSDREQFLEANHYSNLQPLWAEDNFKKSNKVDSCNKPKMYIVCGPCGSGKSWVCDQLAGVLSYVSYDNTPKEEHYYRFIESVKNKKDILYDPLRKPVTILNRYKDRFNVMLLVIDEDRETILSRIKQRGGKPNAVNTDKALKKVQRWNKSAHFSGTSSEVLNFLKTQI